MEFFSNLKYKIQSLLWARTSKNKQVAPNNKTEGKAQNKTEGKVQSDSSVNTNNKIIEQVKPKIVKVDLSDKIEKMQSMAKPDELTDNDKLTTLKMLYGDNVMCTNGLFHILDNDHMEIYLSSTSYELDHRAKYHTIVVTDNAVVTQIANGKEPSYAILRKGNLELMYITNNEIRYADDNIMYEIQEESFNKKKNKEPYIKLISHTGKILTTIPYGKQLECIMNNDKYVISSLKSYCDCVVQYNSREDSIRNLTEGKSYSIYKSRNEDDTVEIVSMHGGTYTYNFKTRECRNDFTGSVEKIHLWSLN